MEVPCRPPGSLKEFSEDGLKATIRLLRLRLKQYDVDRAKDRLTNAVVRGATAGLALRGGLHLVTYILGLLLAKRRITEKSGSRPGALDLLQDTLRWGAFLGSFAGVYVFSDEAIALLGGRKRTSKWRAFASGAAAGPTLLLTGPKARHTSLAVYILLRGISLLVRCGNLPSAHPRIRAAMAPTRWQHGDAALMCLSTIQIVYSWIVLPQTFPPSYTRFLNKHGGKPVYAYDAVRELLHYSRGGVRGPFRLHSLKGTPQQKFCGSTPCQFLHPGVPCRSQPLYFFPGSYLRSLPVYLPVYVIPALLVHGRNLLRLQVAPALWRKVGMGVLRSSLFLSTYCTLAWVGACLGFNAYGHTSALAMSSFTWLAGLSVLIEKKSRRMELAMYVLSRVVEAFGLCLCEWGYASPTTLPRRMDVILFSLATAAICHCYSDHYGERRKVFRTKYLTVFDFILGNTGFQEASIRHEPSNVAIISRAQLRISTSVHRLLHMAATGGGGGVLEEPAVAGAGRSRLQQSSRASTSSNDVAEEEADCPGSTILEKHGSIIAGLNERE